MVFLAANRLIKDNFMPKINAGTWKPSWLDCFVTHTHVYGCNWRRWTKVSLFGMRKCSQYKSLRQQHLKIQLVWDLEILVECTGAYTLVNENLKRSHIRLLPLHEKIIYSLWCLSRFLSESSVLQRCKLFESNSTLTIKYQNRQILLCMQQYFALSQPDLIYLIQDKHSPRSAGLEQLSCCPTRPRTLQVSVLSSPEKKLQLFISSTGARTCSNKKPSSWHRAFGHSVI